MIENLVRYLKAERASFRLLSFPRPQSTPEIAFPQPHTSRRIDTHVVLVGSRIGLAVVSAGERVDVAALARELGVPSMVTTAAELPPPFDKAEHVPPFGGLMGVPVFVDARVTADVLVFKAFCDEDYIEISLEELSRVEKPKTAAFATSGALPPHADQPGISAA